MKNPINDTYICIYLYLFQRIENSIRACHVHNVTLADRICGYAYRRHACILAVQRTTMITAPFIISTILVTVFT